jgi:ubiquinol-cytochrome c reductase cytochrome b subunit
MLRFIQNKLGGSIKLRSGAKALRWRLHNKQAMINLVSRINGNIKHTSRLVQLNKVSLALNIKAIDSNQLHINNSWYAGFFDADGTIGYYFKNDYPQLTISVTNKLKVDIEYFFQRFNGNIYFDRAQNGYYKWSIQSKQDITNFLEYAKTSKFRSNKAKRFFLINEYYNLISLKAYKQDKNSSLYKAWIKFENKWNSYVIK